MDLDMHAFAEELTKTIDEFDGEIAEFELDPKSAVLKSEGFVLKLRRIISKVFSGENNSKSKSSENSTIPISSSREKRNLETEGEQVEDEAIFRRKSRRLITPRNKHSNSRPRLPIFGRIISAERAEQIEKADQHLRAVETETSEGFYTLHKCLLCNQDFNLKSNGRLHVLRVHFKIGSPCRACTNVFFSEESLRRHMSKCSKITRKKINVESASGDKRFKVHVYSQSKQSNSFQVPPENPTVNVNVKVRNPFDGFSLKKAMGAKIKLDRLKLDQNENPNKKPANPTNLKGNEETRRKEKSEVMEKTNTKKRAKTASECQNSEHEKSRIFDVEGAQLICGIEQSFLV